MFGSFQAEEKEPIYGITKPLATWNPVWANLHHYVDLAKAMPHAPSFGEGVKLWFKGPGWQPDWVKQALYSKPFVSPRTHGEAGKYDRRAPRAITLYAMVQFLIGLAVALVLLWGEHRWTWSERIGLAVVAIWTVLDVGLLFDRNRKALPLELLRLAGASIAACLWAATSLQGAAFAAVVVACLVLASASAAGLLRYRPLLSAG
jgi:hypothetical protein